jgi:uncharacterized protein YndB with AHSA1/START domain
VRTIRTEVGIDRPAAAVWAILVDIEAMNLALKARAEGV